jgi:NADPH-dependent 2,4-dienoyl-CoA reductase/sulfur reductase-like enzyme
MKKKYTYIIVGSGMAAASAVEGIRELDSDGSIAMFSKESNLPYDRPPLSKGLWQEGSPEMDDIWRETSEYENIDFYLDRAIVKIVRDENAIIDEKSDSYQYEKLLLATGGKPITLPFDPDGKNVLYFRTLQDYLELSNALEENQRFGVIGGGFIGAEIAASLRINNKDVVMIFPEEAVGSSRYPEQIANLITEKFKNEDIEIVAGELVTDVSVSGSNYTITTESGQIINVDKAVAGIGIKPNTGLAEDAGLEVGDGIIVDKTLRTSDVNIWAAGDVASFYNPHLERRIRVEHAENAKQMGKVAGRNMVGEFEPYNTLPLFYSDMFDMGFEAVGELDPNLNVVIDWKMQPEKGVVYYLNDDKGSIEGIILWNVWGKVDVARELIDSDEHFEPVSVINRI